MGNYIMNAKKRKVIIIVATALLFVLFVLPMGLAVVVHESNFGDRYEKYTPMSRDISEFQELKADRYTFLSNKGQELVGYTYYKEQDEYKGLVIIAHGLGGGGHNLYMGVADYFASNGYVVFAYDATGNDESEGDSIKGVPQGVVDLDYAIRFIKERDELRDFPIMLFGHSWGAYSAGSVLKAHSDVRAVVMISGFNESMDIISEEGRRIAGGAFDLLAPYMSLYERMKFGKHASYNCFEGFEESEAGVMIVYSAKDEMISEEKSYGVFYEAYKDDSRFEFVKYDDRSHDYMFYSDVSREYMDEFNAEFEEYVDSLEVEFTAEIKAEYLKEHLDKNRLYDLDDELMSSIIKLYDMYAK